MSIIGSARGVLWARRRQPEDVMYPAALAQERFPPEELLEQAIDAERAGFDGVCCSDHLAPWRPEGDPAPAESGNAWVWLGAAGQATNEVSLGPAVTAIVYRYNPVVVAQQTATLERLNPGRAFVGIRCPIAGRPSTCPLSANRPRRSPGATRTASGPWPTSSRRRA
jgi:coenzyme F420-dependent glucose-6-phosphate dehydrogenase